MVTCVGVGLVTNAGRPWVGASSLVTTLQPSALNLSLTGTLCIRCPPNGYPVCAHDPYSRQWQRRRRQNHTIAVNVAAVLAQRGRDVLLIDGDEQGSAATFAQLRAELPEKSDFATIQLQGAAIRQQMRQLREKYNEIVIDVGGRDTGSLRAALTVSDAILIPFQPRSVDLWAGVQIASLVAEAREVNERLRACSFLNMADAQGHDNGEALEALKTMVGVEALPSVIVRRKAFPNSFSNGLTVTEQLPKDPKAIDELLSVVDAMYTQQVDDGYQDAPHRKAG
jgi:chromosome partitioning protein